jgi:hypothetical protein
MIEDGTAVTGWQAAANVAQRSVAAVRKLVAAGRLPAEKTSAGIYSFRRVDLECLPPVQGGASRDAPSPVSPALPSSGARENTEVADAAVGGGTKAVLHPASASAAANPVPAEDGHVAAAVFAALEAGKSLPQIVVELTLEPDSVRRLHEDWRALRLIDDLRARPGEERLGALEAAVSSLASQLAHVVAAGSENQAFLLGHVDVVAHALAAIKASLRYLANAAAVARLDERLRLVEGHVRSQPAAPMLTEHRCGRCGHGRLAIPVGCPVCGFGVGPPSV